MHFTITGEAMTKLSRDFWVEGRHIFAINFLTKGLHGFSKEFAIQVLTGHKKLVGEKDLELKDDNTIHHESILLSLKAAWNRCVKIYLSNLSQMIMLQRRIVLLTQQASPKGMLYRKGKHDEFNRACDKKNYKQAKSLLKDSSEAIYIIGELVGKGFADIPYDKMNIQVSGVDEGYYMQFNPIDSEEILSTADEIEKRYGFSPGPDDVERFIMNEKKISETIKEGISPINMNGDYDAGWLSPDGVYYGLNGDIANMLHINIADSLADQGVIPEKEKPDAWMEKNGWVRQHGNHILFDGYSRKKYELGDNVPLTDKQIKAIYEFGQKCHKGILVLGHKRIAISAARFSMTEKTMLYRYFEL